jgi:hypothetical protein
MRFSSNGYFFFFLAVFFAFFFFAFLAMLPSAQMLLNASRPSTCMNSEYTTIAKLILRASNKVNEPRAVATTAKSLGLVAPQPLPVAADEVIE